LQAIWLAALSGTYNLAGHGLCPFADTHAARIGRKDYTCYLPDGRRPWSPVHLLIHNPIYLHVAMIGVGLAWASILAMPYVILSSSIPAAKMGIYMVYL